MHDYCKQIDTNYDADVRQRNKVETTEAGLRWTWLSTGATVDFKVEGPHVAATVGAGLYGTIRSWRAVFPTSTFWGPMAAFMARTPADRRRSKATN